MIGVVSNQGHLLMKATITPNALVLVVMQGNLRVWINSRTGHQVGSVTYEAHLSLDALIRMGAVKLPW